MIDKKYIELIHKELDGATSPEESAKLKAYFRQNQEAQELYQDLAKMTETLDHVNEIDPSPNLKKNILNAIDENKYKSAERTTSPKFSFSTMKRNIKFGYAFAAGLIIGLIIYSSLFEPSLTIDPTQLTGTMMFHEINNQLNPIDQFTLNAENASGTVHFKSKEQILLAEFHIQSQQQLQIHLELGSDAIDFQGLNRLNKGNVDFQINDRVIQINQQGECHYFVLLSDHSPPSTTLQLKIFLNDVLLLDRNLFSKEAVE